MDITPLFKACVRTVKTRNKALGSPTPLTLDKKRILPTQGRKFTVKAKELVGHIKNLKEFLLDYRKKYYVSCSAVSELDKSLSNEEMEQIDTGAHKIMRKCAQMLKDLKLESTKNISGQILDHRLAVFDMIEKYLKTVCLIHSEQQAVRVKKLVDHHKLSRLELPGQGKINHTLSTPDVEKVETNSGYIYEDDTCDESEFTAEEIQMFELENSRLYNELNQLQEEVSLVEKNVVHIAELQEVLNDHLLNQELQLGDIHTSAVNTTMNVTEGNTFIREGMKKKASGRVITLFVLILLSFVILFLDWMND